MKYRKWKKCFMLYILDNSWYVNAILMFSHIINSLPILLPPISLKIIISFTTSYKITREIMNFSFSLNLLVKKKSAIEFKWIRSGHSFEQNATIFKLLSVDLFHNYFSILSRCFFHFAQIGVSWSRKKIINRSMKNTA